MRVNSEQMNALQHLAQASSAVQALRARAHSLPERAELEELKKKHSAIRDRQTQERVSQRHTDQELHRLRQDIAKMRRRRTAAKKMLHATTDKEQRKDLYHDLDSTSHRLADMEHRLAALQRTRGLFQDGTEGSPTDDSDSGLVMRIHEAEDRVRAAVEKIRSEASAQEAEVARARQQLPTDVLEAFDTQEAEHGVGAAPLKGRVCQACFMELDPMTMKEYRDLPDGVIPRCPECNVLLIVHKEGA